MQKEHRKPAEKRERLHKCVTVCVWRAYHGHQRAHNMASSRSVSTSDAPATQKKGQRSLRPACHSLTRTARDPNEPEHAHTSTLPAPSPNLTKKHNSLPHAVRLPQTTLSPGRPHRSTRGPHAANPHASSCCLWTGGERPRGLLVFPPLPSPVCASEAQNEKGSHWKSANASEMRQCPCFACFPTTTAHKTHWSA